MTDRETATVHHIVVQSRPSTIERPQNHAHAAKSLDDANYLAYVICQGAKLVIALLSKRWPNLG